MDETLLIILQKNLLWSIKLILIKANIIDM
jgi:hypothetical protein